jgi:cell division protein FtsQ
MKRVSAKHNRFKHSKPEYGERQPLSREWGRIFNRLLLVAAVMGFVYGVDRLGSQLESIPVDRVVFAGDFRHVSREILVDRVTSHLAVGYIGLDLEGIQSELEQEPWVYRAIVERVWPRALKITIVEETPIAVWGNGGLLNHRGKIFLPAKGLHRDASLPLLAGPGGGAIEIMRQYRLMSELLGDESLVLQRLQMNDRGAWTATLKGGVVLVLGRQEPLEKLRRFMWVYRQQLAADFEQVKRVDTRYINGLAVSWHQLEGS